MTDPSPSDLKPVILQGDCREVMRSLPAGSVDCVVTSPPFFSLRRYDLCPCSQYYVREEGAEHPLPRKADRTIRELTPDPHCAYCGGTGEISGMESTWGGDDPGCVHEWEATPPRRNRLSSDVTNPNCKQATNPGSTYDAKWGKQCQRCGAWFGALGLEPTVAMYIDHLMEVMAEVHRVLKDTGIAWIEIGDSYAAHPAGPIGGKRWATSSLMSSSHEGAEQAGSIDKRRSGISEKSLLLVPFRFAIACQEAGWIVRDDIIWARTNPMPESVKDRPTRAHSFVFMLVKRPRYFYDPDGYRETLSEDTHARVSQRTLSIGWNPKTVEPGNGVKSNTSFRTAIEDLLPNGYGRNLRDAWILSTEPLSEPHYAAFPTEIPRRAILLSTSARGNCAECGAPWSRVVFSQSHRTARKIVPVAKGDASRTNGTGWLPPTRVILGDTRGFPWEGVTGNPQTTESLHRDGGGVYPSSTPVGWVPTCGCQEDPCEKCGKPWVHQEVRREAMKMNIRVRDAKKGTLSQKSGLGGLMADASEEEIEQYDETAEDEMTVRLLSTAWPSCSCHSPLPALVLDPFAGSGTTLKVARELGRRSIGIELNPFYCDIARRRAGQFADLERFT